MKILALGNSFSHDATQWLAETAAAQGVELTVGNLVIGGCSLQTHDRNIREDLAAYAYMKTGCEIRTCSVREALLEEAWDAVTFQQASHFSGMYDTYQPYLNRISEYVRSVRPGARQWIHETWAYEKDSDHPGFADYDRDQGNMYARLKAAYEKAAGDIGAAIIPCGDAFQRARAMPEFDYGNGGMTLNRDGFHASWTYGRYMLSCVWLESLARQSCLENGFVPRWDNEAEPEPGKLALVRKAAHLAVAERKEMYA